MLAHSRGRGPGPGGQPVEASVEHASIHDQAFQVIAERREVVCVAHPGRGRGVIERDRHRRRPPTATTKESTIRTVSENAATLHFESHSFEGE